MMERRLTSVVAATLLVAGLAVFGLTGCGSSSSGSNLVPAGFQRGTRGAMDGFVFVPSRANTAIPNARVMVYEVVGNGQPDRLIAQTQANNEGFYRVDNQPLNKLIRIEAVDPFQLPDQPQRKVSGVLSFAEAEARTRNLNPPSTLAAAIVGVQGTTAPLSDSQVSGLETAAEERLSQPGAPDITADPNALTKLAQEMASTTFGTADVFVFSEPTVQATVLVNGVAAGKTTTLKPGSTAGANSVHLSDLAAGLATITVTAPGFVDDQFTVQITAGQNASVQRTLHVAGAPRIIDQRAVPERLPSTGGEVTLQAIVYSEAGEKLNVVAEVTLPGTTTVRTVNLSAVDKYLYVGKMTAAANTSSVNATYTVKIKASPAARPLEVAQSVSSFQVGGLR